MSEASTTTTTMRWTRTPPSEGGWYWWRPDRSWSATIVRVQDGRITQPANLSHPWPSWRGGEWYGPLEEPEDETVSVRIADGPEKILDLREKGSGY